MIVNRSPAIPTFMGSIRFSVAAVATAASTAFPPFIRIRKPACAATDWLVVTIPCWAMVSDRPCLSHPSDRSPGTALQKGGFTVPCGTLHDCTGDDWALAAVAPTDRPFRSPLTSLQITTSSGDRARGLLHVHGALEGRRERVEAVAESARLGSGTQHREERGRAPCFRHGDEPGRVQLRAIARGDMVHRVRVDELQLRATHHGDRRRVGSPWLQGDYRRCRCGTRTPACHQGQRNQQNCSAHGILLISESLAANDSIDLASIPTAIGDGVERRAVPRRSCPVPAEQFVPGLP